MSSTRSVPDKQTQKWLNRFSGIKAEPYFAEGVGTKRYVMWNDFETGDGTRQWIKLDHSGLVCVRR